MAILQFKDIVVKFKLRRGILCALDNVSLDIQAGEIMGIVGESGCGKSTLASVALNIVSPPGEIVNGQVLYNGKDILKLSREEIRAHRWNNIAMVFQAAQNSLNPVIKIKDHFIETAKAHNSTMSEDEILAKARKLMHYVRLDAERVLNSYPHQLSGGMKQRTIIAMSLLLDPQVLILDEPTTALDVITQAYIVDILRDIHASQGITMIFLTHDVSIIAKIADRIAVMYAGQVVEVGTVDDIFYHPLHPYTSGLIHAAPSLIDDINSRQPIPGSPPDLINPPSGCRFAMRCRLYDDSLCNAEDLGKIVEVKPGHFTRCINWERMGE